VRGADWKISSIAYFPIGNLSQSLKYALIADEKSPARISHRVSSQ